MVTRLGSFSPSGSSHDAVHLCGTARSAANCLQCNLCSYKPKASFESKWTAWLQLSLLLDFVRTIPFNPWALVQADIVQASVQLAARDATSQRDAVQVGGRQDQSCKLLISACDPFGLHLFR